MTGRTLFDKIWTAHTVAALPGNRDAIVIDRMTLHELGGGIALRDMLRSGVAPTMRPYQVFGVADHVEHGARPGAAFVAKQGRQRNDPGAGEKLRCVRIPLGRAGRAGVWDRSRRRARAGLRTARHHARVLRQSYLHHRRLRHVGIRGRVERSDHRAQAGRADHPAAANIAHHDHRHFGTYEHRR